MARRPTVRDVAREAGVSVTTVDRALNDRLKVREETLRKIAEAARPVGHHGRTVRDYPSAPPPGPLSATSISQSIAREGR